MRTLEGISATLAFTLISACGGVSQSYGREASQLLASEDLHCPETEISVFGAGEGRYEAVGCGREARYECREDEYGRALCYRILASGTSSSAEAQSAAQAEPDPDAEPDDDDQVPEPPEPVEERSDETGNERGLDARIRRLLDGRRPQILACVGVAEVAIRVTVPEEGPVVLGLQGDRAGSPEEGCVQELFADGEIPRSEGSHTIVHLVR